MPSLSFIIANPSKISECMGLKGMIQGFIVTFFTLFCIIKVILILNFTFNNKNLG